MSQAKQDELKCLRALVRGEDAWPEFLQLFSRGLYCEFASYGIHPGIMRDELLSDLMLRLLANNHRVIRNFIHLDTGFSFKSLLRKIVRSIVIDRVRSQQRWANVELSDQLEGLPQYRKSSFGGDPAQRFAQNREFGDLLAQLDGYQHNQGIHVLFLRFVEGYSVKDIAERIGTSPNAVSQRLKYYLGKLRHLLKGSDGYE